ncbi:DUF924 domain-containing protein [Candidatus Hepatincola sp. Av]
MADLQEILDFWFTLTPESTLIPTSNLVEKTKSKFLSTYTKYKNSITLNPQTPQEYLALIILFYNLPKIMFTKTEEIHETDSFATTLAEIAVERGYDLQIQSGKSLLYKPLLASSNLAIRKLGKQLLQVAKLEEEMPYSDSKILHFPHSDTKEEDLSNKKTDIAKEVINKTKETPKKIQEHLTQEHTKKTDANNNKGQIIIPIKPNNKGTLLITQQNSKNTLLAPSKSSSLVIQQPPIENTKDSMHLKEPSKEMLKTSPKATELKEVKEESTITTKPNPNKNNKESIKHNLKKHQILHNNHFHVEKEKHEITKENNHNKKHDLHQTKHLHVSPHHIKHHSSDDGDRKLKLQKIHERMQEIRKHNMHHMQKKNNVIHHNTPTKNPVHHEEILQKQNKPHHHESKIHNKVHDKEYLIHEKKDKINTLHSPEHHQNHKDSENIIKLQAKPSPSKEQTNKEKILQEVKKQVNVASASKPLETVKSTPTKAKPEEVIQHTTPTKNKVTKASSVTIISKQPKVITDICNVKETINTTPKTNLGNVVN